MNNFVVYCLLLLNKYLRFFKFKFYIILKMSYEPKKLSKIIEMMFLAITVIKITNLI